MNHTFIRIDGKIGTAHIGMVLQMIRNIEQIDPDSIHLAISLRDDSHSLVEHLATLRSLNPELPVERFLKREDMTEEQKVAHGWLLKLGDNDA